MLRAVSAFNDKVQELLFRPNHLAPTFSEDQVVKPPRFNAYYDIEDVKPVDGRNWKLELAGRIENKTPWTARPDLRAARTGVDHPPHLRRGLGLYRAMVGRRTCGNSSSASAPTPRRNTSSFNCADDYTETLDMATALHPQTILATKYAKEPITDPFGFPLRLRTADQARIQEREMDHARSK